MPVLVTEALRTALRPAMLVAGSVRMLGGAGMGVVKERDSDHAGPAGLRARAR